jgi:hypothetical protein
LENSAYFMAGALFKIPVPHTSTAITLRAGTVTLMYMINVFAQVVVSKCIYTARRIPYPARIS